MTLARDAESITIGDLTELEPVEYAICPACDKLVLTDDIRQPDDKGTCIHDERGYCTGLTIERERDEQ